MKQRMSLHTPWSKKCRNSDHTWVTLSHWIVTPWIISAKLNHHLGSSVFIYIALGYYLISFTLSIIIFYLACRASDTLWYILIMVKVQCTILQFDTQVLAHFHLRQEQFCSVKYKLEFYRQPKVCQAIKIFALISIILPKV